MKMHMNVYGISRGGEYFLAQNYAKMWKVEGKLISPREILSVFFLFSLLEVVMKGSLIGFVKKIKKVFNGGRGGGRFI